ncbi:hypothetical protein TEA_002776 [Camellia sinensis var. sinensis]|uniref:Peptidase M3A/M3B catalytic domain-containing protein n=1 Tax=Camellia sinensis var. sinensis TaxID=542762 RepID=A0A4S4D0M4_CAMSN|nr:hypothetical protein TEA_002776 [Camellia sinensis var. sinensis]
MSKQKIENRNTNLIALSGGAAALLAIAINFAINALKKNRKKKDLLGSTVQINLSPPEILRLANRIIAKSKEVHDSIASVPLDKVNLSPPEILRLANRIIAKSKEAHDSIASVPLDKVTYTTAILPLAELEAQQFPLVQSCVFPKLVSTSEDVRKASAEAERRIDAHVSSCRGFFLAASTVGFIYLFLIIQWQVRDFERSGLSLTLTKREELQQLSAQIDELSGRYIQNLNDDSTSLLISETQLVGLPPEFLESLDKAENGKFKVTLRSHHVSPILELCKVRDFEHSGLSLTLTKREELQQLSAQIDELSGQYIQNLNDDSMSLLSLDKAENGKFKVTLRSHHVSPILELCKVGLTRRIVAVAYGRRCEVNLSILESLVQLRHKSVGLFGYSNYADYAVNQRMANSSSKVFEFLEELSASLTDLATRELSMLKDLKVFEFLEELSASLTDLATRELSMLKDLKKKAEGDFPFGIEDLLYYVKRIEEQQFNLDVGALKQYFPFNLVMLGILKICHDLFGLRFEEIADAEVWHSDVHLYSVYDLSSSELLGYFYLDMFSREGKYGHTCVVALQNGSFVNGARKIPVALLTSQLQKEVGHTALLRFSEVVNLFHEFGHVLGMAMGVNGVDINSPSPFPYNKFSPFPKGITLPIF